MKRISVILPVYNAAKYLKGCLRSILAQDIEGLEVIAVNDGSTDRSLKILQQFARRDQRLVVIDQANAGVAAARNRAIKRASGEYLAFCDSDDTVPPGAYRAFWKNVRRRPYDIVVGDHYNARDDEPDKLHPTDFVARRRNSDFIAVIATPCMWNKLIRRQFVLDHKIKFPRSKIGEDVEFLATCLLYSPIIKREKQPVYIHWHHTADAQTSLNHSYSLADYKWHLHCRERIRKLSQDTANEAEANEFLRRPFMLFLIYFLYHIRAEAERDAAFRLLKKYVKKLPYSSETMEFEGVFGVSRAEFLRTKYSFDYLFREGFVSHREIMIKEFNYGLVGARYILKYFRGWLRFKIYRGRRDKDLLQHH